MTYSAYALPSSGAIVFRHVRGGQGAMAGHLRIAEGDPVVMPARVLALAERDGPCHFVPGYRAATTNRKRAWAVRKFKSLLNQPRPGRAASSSETGGRLSGPERGT